MSEAREEWRERVSRWRASGLTASAFALEEGVRATTLSWWAWRLKREPTAGRSARRSAPSTVGAMIEVRARPVADDRFEVELGGRRVRVPPAFDAEALRRLIGVLEGDAS